MRRHTVRTAVGLGALASVAALGLAVTATGPAAAVPAPGFLEPGDLPPHASSAWFAGDVTAGVPDPEPFCLEGAVPAAGSHHRFFWTDLDTNAQQVTVTAASDAAARRLAGALERSVAGCAGDWLRDTPGGTASWQDYGTVDAGDGAHLYGVHTSLPESEPGVNLFGVGRDGRTVTVVRWAEMGDDLAATPLNAFTHTTGTAVDRLG